MALPITSLLAHLLVAATPPNLIVENCEFPEAYAFSDQSCQITLDNRSDKAVRVFDIVADSPKDSSELHEITVAPHSHAYATLHVNTDNDSGYSSHSFRFHTSDPMVPMNAVKARGFVLSALDQPRPELDFAVVDMDKELPEKTLELGSHDGANFQIQQILEKPSWVDAEISADRRSVRVRIRADAPLGLHGDLIKLKIDTPFQKQASILVKADIHGDVVPATNPFNMGLLRIGEKNQFRIAITSRSGKPFSVGKVELERVEGETKLLPCLPESAGCRWIELTISDKQPMGTIKGNIWVELPTQHKRLQIALRGLFVSKDFKVRTLDPDKSPSDKPKEQGAAESSVAPNIATDLSKSIQNALQQADEAPPPGNGPLLKWTVANGLLVYGFQIFRAEKEDGPFVLQNSPTMRAASEDNSPISYQWRDTHAESGKTYWYYIGLVFKDGHKQNLTGPQKVVAK
jgi:hypothetical protein